MTKLKLALCQMMVGADKKENIEKASLMVQDAQKRGAELVVLPEMFNCPYQTEMFPKYAEEEGGTSYQALSRMARENNVYLVGGSCPELDSGKVYNTSYVFSPSGELLAKHRKIHLFDIDIKGGQSFKESETLSAGDTPTVFDTPWGKIGLLICFDLRFPELSRLYAYAGAELIIVPGAFNMTTGPLHWELLFRSRALDNQLYTVGVAPARDESTSYISYAHSIVADPWGKIIHDSGTEENISLVELDLSLNKKVRAELPLLKSLRQDVYMLTQAPPHRR